MRLRKNCPHKEWKSRVETSIYKRYRIVVFCRDCGKIKRTRYRMERMK